jgi:putative aldouronate transport system permease protein
LKNINSNHIKNKMITTLIKQKNLHLMVLPTIILVFVFCYLPMYGIQIGFKEFQFNYGIWGSPWVGLKYFKEVLTDPYIFDALVNTLGISLLRLIIMFPLSILLAIMINEITNLTYKKFVQTISYMPHFISWAILSTMAHAWLSPSSGFVNAILVDLGVLKDPYFFLGEPKTFWLLSAILSTWKDVGWASIIYLAVIVSINPELYESAIIDGANIFHRVWYITIPSILGTIMLVLILNVGSILQGNFEISYLLGNSITSERSQIIDTYVLKIGLSMARYSYGTVVGLLSGMISLILVVMSNSLSKKLTGHGLF